ncbi:glycosyltransferase involved in cell wall biosynthesis [Pararhizobium capsulatum DSM 1112]|uniref:Glycosyltransferase involved in cell wall biosynthesis n=1 Tax=Pararhizobium capsulatum DSM 1112 TaxID=1121113 RepID=A0ABU0BXK3_9HYPH|nr:glycosyltransferase involved in cell wall biosynthesis [Pararhizobium capsulatum DSM 1112]
MAELDVDVCVFGGTDQFYDEDKPIWEDLHLSTFASKKGSYGFNPSVLRQLKLFKPDILHVHGIWSAASIYALLTEARGVPVVVSPRGMLDPWIVGRRRSVKALHAFLLERPVLKKAHIHALSDSEYESVIKFMPSARERTFIIPNGIASDKTLESTALGRKRGALYLGRLHPKKQVLELITAWNALPQSSANQLTIAGWGEPEYEKAVRELVAGTPNVQFIGSAYGDEKDKLLATSQYFVLPSLSEGLPMAVLEALQQGCIPILTEECNLPELFDVGVAIRIKKDFSDFDEILPDVLSRGGDNLTKMAYKALHCSERYHWSHIARQMLDKYIGILAK